MKVVSEFWVYKVFLNYKVVFEMLIHYILREKNQKLVQSIDMKYQDYVDKVLNYSSLINVS